MSASLTVVDDRVACKECGFRSHSLLSHLQEAHSFSASDYLAKHPGAATVSQSLLKKYNTKGSRTTAPAPTDLSVNLMGIDLPVDAAVAEGDCLMLPDGYMFPTQGKAKQIFIRAIMAMARGRHCYIWGMPSTGKDAIVHAFSAYTRKPVVMVTFRPGTDLAPWFYTRSISGGETGWDYGHLWNVLVNGVEGRDGKRRPALVLLSDVDRADAAQAEWFRILTDSISGRILGPDGQMVPLLAGTQFVCTANSCGTGDARGRMTSSNPIDASILDRLGRKIEAEYLDWEDESVVLRAKFPEVAQADATVLGDGTKNNKGQLGKASQALREAIKNETLYAEFTHRALCDIMMECEDVMWANPGNTPGNLLKLGFRAWLDGLDGDSRLEANRLIDAHLLGGAI